jgi:nucleoside-diphosphate-sugar epimerase
MDTQSVPVVLVTGATGRVGTLLRAAWTQRPPAGFRPVWQTRRAAGPGWISWDMLGAPCPDMTPAPAVILNLAGAPPAREDALSDNLALARAAHDAAQLFGSRHLFLASSAAVYEADVPGLMPESLPPRPATPYGRAKAEMERAALTWSGPAVTILRIGNVVGADALLGAARPGAPVRLDPVPGERRGPERSWIGPATLADAFEGLITQALASAALPDVLNLAQAPTRFMGEMLDAAWIPWQFGPHNPRVARRVALAGARLAHALPRPLPPADPARMIAEWRSLARLSA